MLHAGPADEQLTWTATRFAAEPDTGCRHEPLVAPHTGTSTYLGQNSVEGVNLSEKLHAELVQRGSRETDRELLGPVRYLAAPIPEKGRQLIHLERQGHQSPLRSRCRAPGRDLAVRNDSGTRLQSILVSAISYPESIVIGALQGITELFPISSLGHSVLVPAIIGGRWAQDLNVSAPESPYLSFIVGLHVATALALLLLFWRDWVRIVRGFFSSVRTRSITTSDERLAWIIVIATVPVGLTGLALEHTFRTTLGRPVPAALFLTLNGFVLLGGERLRRRDSARGTSAGASNGRVYSYGIAGDGVGGSVMTSTPAGAGVDDRLAGLGWRRALVTGAAQSLALLPGISRSGVTMVAGLRQGLTHEEAVRLSFLLATPVILAAGLLKLPDFAGPLGAGIHGQILAGSAAAFACAYLAARFLTRWFETRTLTPFAIYCLVAGPAALLLVSR